MPRLFVYGTLRHPPLRDALLGRPVPSVPGSLPGHRAAPMRGRPYPGLVFDPDARAAGDLIEVDERELAVLDDFEGPQYERRAVVVDVGDGTVGDGTVGAEAYLLADTHRGAAEGGVWSLDHFVEHEAPRWVEGG